jgi:large subunit ribosomal protein L4
MSTKTSPREKQGEASNGVHMQTDIYNTQGKKTGAIELPESVFGVKWNDSLMHQAITSMLANARLRVAHTKSRGDVRGGGRKPWQQKGRARHGSIRSPIWKGGGVTHGPRSEKVYARTLPKKMRAKALSMALSRKLKDGEVLFVDSFRITAPKTADAKKVLTNLAGVKGFEKLLTKKKNAALLALAGKSEAAQKSFRNIGSISTADIRNLNPVSVLESTYLIIENPAHSLPVITSRLSKEK